MLDQRVQTSIQGEQVAAAKAYCSKDLAKAHAAVIDIQRVVKEAQVEMQALLQQLGPTPLENTQLADALRTQAEALKYRSGLEMNVRIGDLPNDEFLAEGAQETIFRLVQEAFANIARHARDICQCNPSADRKGVAPYRDR